MEDELFNLLQLYQRREGKMSADMLVTEIGKMLASKHWDQLQDLHKGYYMCKAEMPLLNDAAWNNLELEHQTKLAKNILNWAKPGTKPKPSPETKPQGEKGDFVL